jgi:SAM-dependent methyltransferase
MKKEWFEEWFDSPYYHILYKARDENEARNTLDNLLQALALPPGAGILDLACGKGRHSRYLAEKGYDVTGLDISQKSISYARQFEHERLSFFQHDMRKLFRSNYFDAVMNLFTSFGYFSTELDHLHALQNIAKGLKPGGLLLLDYFNSNWIREHLIAAETKTVEGVEFHLKKHIEGQHVYKSIELEAEGKHFRFRERVRLFDLTDFMTLFEQSGLNIRKTYGGYDLSPFDLKQSNRLILVAQKTS